MKNTNTIVVVLSILVIVSIIINVGQYMSLMQTRDQLVRANTTIAEQKQDEIDAAKAQADRERQAVIDKLKISWPTANSQLCYEQQYSISWQTPLDMEAVTINLVTPTASEPMDSIKIGDFPAFNGRGDDVGYGSTQWDLTDNKGHVVPESKVYKLMIGGTLGGQYISTTTDGVFSVGYCR